MTRHVRAAVFTEDSGEYCEFQDFVLASPGPDELVVQVKACGICHTDVGISQYSERPCVLGHEAAGVIVEVGNNISKFVIGERVTATFSACLQCETCESGRPAYCMDHISRNFDGLRPNGERSLFDKNGAPVFSAFFQQSGFANYMIVQKDNIVKIPDHLPFEHAAPLGCGIQTGAGTVLNTLNAKTGEPIVIFGVGAVGLSAVMAANIRGCNPIIAVDIEADRLDFALKYGAHHGLKGNSDSLVENIKALTGGGSIYAIEGTGVEAIYQSAINCLRPGGKCATLGYPGVFGEPIKHPGSFAFMNTTQIGAIEGDSVPSSFIPELINLYQKGIFPYTDLITPYAFSDINLALKELHEKRVIKPVLVFD